MEYDKLDVYYKLNNDHQTVEITVDGNEYVKGMDITTEEVVVTLKVYNGLKELANTYTMKVIRKELPDGVKSKFITKIGKKVKVVNTKYLKNRTSNGKIKREK